MRKGSTFSFHLAEPQNNVSLGLLLVQKRAVMPYISWLHLSLVRPLVMVTVVMRMIKLVESLRAQCAQ